MTSALGICGVCTQSASVVDWGPLEGWLAVEGCPCGGFFIWKALWEGRLPGMATTECQELASRIREWRRAVYEVWISTIDRTLHGRLFLSSARPPRAPREHPRSYAEGDTP